MSALKYRLADRLLLLKCYDSKMVKLPGYSSVGASSCSKPTKKQKTYDLNNEAFVCYSSHDLNNLKFIPHYLRKKIKGDMITGGFNS